MTDQHEQETPTCASTHSPEARRRTRGLAFIITGVALILLGCAGTPTLLIAALVNTGPAVTTAVPGRVTFEASAERPVVLWTGRSTDGSPNSSPPRLSELNLSVADGSGIRLIATPTPDSSRITLTRQSMVFSPLAEVKVPQRGTITLNAAPADGVTLPPGAVVGLGEDATGTYTFIGAAAFVVVGMSGLVLVVLGFVFRGR